MFLMYNSGSKRGTSCGWNDEQFYVHFLNFQITALIGNIPYLSARWNMNMCLRKKMVKKYIEMFHNMKTADLLSDVKIKF